MAQNVFSGHALGVPWASFGAKIFRNFFLQNYTNWSMENPKMLKKIENFFSIVAHLGHQGLTLRKFFEILLKIIFFSLFVNGLIRKVEWSKPPFEGILKIFPASWWLQAILINFLKNFFRRNSFSSHANGLIRKVKC